MRDASGAGKKHGTEGHVRGAIKNGATVIEIREVLLHSAIPAGARPAVEAFRSTREVLDELGLSIPHEA
jgi:4-carboxymuconolactone decarboxylase